MVQNGQVNLQDEQFLTFEHTDGLNYENLGIEKYQKISTSKTGISYGLMELEQVLCSRKVM